MKKLSSNIAIFILTALSLSYFMDANAGTCSSISRTNFSANSVLTSTELNSQFNTVYGATNALDGGCVTDGTLELDATDSSWDNLKDYLQAGCKVTYSNASTLSISKCYLAVNGAFVGKSTATSVSFGCTNCSAEANSTDYYVYVADGSTGTTLTPLITTTAPNEDGYDASNNKVLAKFYNSSTGDIDQYSIAQWKVNKFEDIVTEWVEYTPTFTAMGTVSNIEAFWKRDKDSLKLQVFWTCGTPSASQAQISLPEFGSGDITTSSVYNIGVGSRNQIIGYGRRDDNLSVFPQVRDGGGDSIFTLSYGSSASSMAPANGNDFCGSGNEVSVFVHGVKITEWTE